MASIQAAVSDLKRAEEIRSHPCPSCFLCGAEGEPLYEGLRDRLFGAPGIWAFKKCPNSKCALVWLDPMPVESDIPLAYQSYYTHVDCPEVRDTLLRSLYRKVRRGYLARRYGYTYPNPRFSDRLLGCLLYLDPYRRADVDFTVFYLHAIQNGRLLELGSGDGRMLAELQKLGWQVEGVDFDSAAVSNAQHKGVNVRLGTLFDQRFPDDSFDAIAMSHLIEHVHEPMALLQECRRVLRPGGRLVVVTPNLASWGHRTFGPNWRGLEPPRHLHLFGLSSLGLLLSRVGFSNVACISTPRGVSCTLASRALRRRGAVTPSTSPVLIQRVRAEAMGLTAWLRVRLNRESGEELLAVATKSAVRVER